MTTIEKLATRIKAAGQTLSVAESFTGGSLSSRITAVAGASEYFIEGIVCYSVAAKIDRLGVNSETVKRYGAVSKATVREMLQGLKSDFRLATSGNAGPGAEKRGEVGRCFIGASYGEDIIVEEHWFNGSRVQIIDSGVEASLRLLAQLVEKYT